MRKIILGAIGGAMLLSLGACAQLSGYFSNPANDLQIAEAGFSTALALYNSVCEQNPGLGICSPADMQQAATLEQAVVNAIQAAEVVLGASQSAAAGTGPTSQQISDAISAVTKAVTNFNNFVNQLQVKKASMMAARSAPH